MKKDKNEAADVHGLAADNAKTESSIKKLCYDGDNWVGIYDPKTKVMLGGYSSDGKTFDNDFKITEVDEENAQDALKFCAMLYVDYGTIVTPFTELKTTYEESDRRAELIHSFEECSWEE